MADELPPIVTRLVGDITGLRDSLAKGKAEVAAWREEVQGGGRDVGRRLGTDIGDGLQDAIPTAFGGQGGAGSLGQRIGAGIGVGIGQGLGESAPLIEDEVDKKVKEPLQTKGKESGAAFSVAFTDALRDTITPSRIAPDSLISGIGKRGTDSGDEFSLSFSKSARDGLAVSPLVSLLAPDGPVGEQIVKDSEKTGDKAGRSAGTAAAGGMSPLIKAAFAGAAAVGPAAVLAGMATAVTGVAALVAESNKQVATDYGILADNISSEIKNAVGPIAGDIDAAVITLEQGVTAIGPQLDQLFAAVGPDATQLASGLDQLATGILPGIVTGVRAFAPEMHGIATDFGKLGQGLGGFVSGLGVGASGATAGFNALSKSLSEVLPDIGQIIGYLSNGLGPALGDIVPVIDGAAKAITLLTGALSPGEIQAATLALAGLFGTFKLASWTGLLQEGAGFTTFLKGTPVAAGEAEGAIKSFATKGVGALSAALDLATGPLGLIIAGAGLLGNELGKLSGVGDHTAGNVDALASAMSDAANGSAQAQGNVNEFANAMVFLANSPGQATDGLKSLDDAMTKLYQSNPQQAASEFASLSKSLEANGVSADQVAKDFPQYSQAVADAKLQSHLLGAQTDQLTSSLITSAQSAHDSAQKTAEQTLAVLGATNGQDKFTVSLDATITAYETASGKASAYKTALDALYGKYQNYSQAEATFTTDLDNASKSLTHGKDAIDLNSKAGAANFTVLSGLATQNEQVAETLLKQSGNQDKANKALQTGAEKIDSLAKSAGFTDTQIAELNKDLYGTASIKDITVTVGANTAPAYKGVGALLNYVNSSGATIHVYETADGIVHNTGMSVQAKADGGFVAGAPGAPVPVIAHGEEYVLSRGMLAGRQAVDPGVLAALRGVAAASSGGGGVALAPAPPATAPPVIVNTFYIDGSQVTGAVRSSAQRYARRNSGTGLT